MSEAVRRPLIVRLFQGLWNIVAWAYRVLVILMLVASLALLWVSTRGGPPVTVEDNVALIVAPSGTLVEQIDLEPAQRIA
ncbi:MAG: signal peptide peptidase SppA, partial [Nevskiaceae bacterium]